MPFKFKCISCKEFIYTDNLSKENYLYNCENCDTRNWINPDFEGLIEIGKDKTLSQKDSKCPKCDFSLTSEDIKNGKCSNCFLNLLEWAKNTVETPTTKPETLKKLKDHLEKLQKKLNLMILRIILLRIEKYLNLN